MFFSFWLTSPCKIGSRFTHLTTTDSNPFLFMGLVLILAPLMALSTCQRHSWRGGGLLLFIKNKGKIGSGTAHAPKEELITCVTLVKSLPLTLTEAQSALRLNVIMSAKHFLVSNSSLLKEYCDTLIIGMRHHCGEDNPVLHLKQLHTTKEN